MWVSNHIRFLPCIDLTHPQEMQRSTAELLTPVSYGIDWGPAGKQRCTYTHCRVDMGERRLKTGKPTQIAQREPQHYFLKTNEGESVLP